MTAGKKITKDAANYRDIEANRTSRHCEDCQMFRAPNACTLVIGFIARRATCRFWEPKEGGSRA